MEVLFAKVVGGCVKSARGYDYGSCLGRECCVDTVKVKQVEGLSFQG